MSRLNRYFFYAIAFVLVVIGIATQSYTVVGIGFVVGLLIAFLTEYFDNRRDQKYKHYNSKHQLHH